MIGRTDPHAGALSHGIVPLQDRADDGRVGAGPADAIGLERLDQRRFCIAGRGLGEMLFRRDRILLRRFALGDLRQAFVIVGNRVIVCGKISNPAPTSA